MVRAVLFTSVASVTSAERRNGRIKNMPGPPHGPMPPFTSPKKQSPVRPVKIVGRTKKRRMGWEGLYSSALSKEVKLIECGLLFHKTTTGWVIG
jgi:hypothetical protein